MKQDRQKVEEILARVIYNDLIHALIQLLRSKFGIPVGGFKNEKGKEYKKWLLEEESGADIQSICIKLYITFGIAYFELHDYFPRTVDVLSLLKDLFVFEKDYVFKKYVRLIPLFCEVIIPAIYTPKQSTKSLIFNSENNSIFRSEHELKMFGDNEGFLIRFTARTTKDDILNFIDKNWSKVKNKQKELGLTTKETRLRRKTIKKHQVEFMASVLKGMTKRELEEFYNKEFGKPFGGHFDKVAIIKEVLSKQGHSITREKLNELISHKNLNRLNLAFNKIEGGLKKQLRFYRS